MTASILINGARAYLHGAVNIAHVGLLYQFTYNSDLAHKFTSSANALAAQALLEDGRSFPAERLIWVSSAPY